MGIGRCLSAKKQSNRKKNKRERGINGRESKREDKTKEKERALDRFEIGKRSVHGQSQTNICSEREGLLAGKHQSYMKGHFNSA